MQEYITPAVDGTGRDLLEALEVIFSQMKQVVDGQADAALQYVAVEHGEIMGPAFQAPYAGLELRQVECVMVFLE